MVKCCTKLEHFSAAFRVYTLIFGQKPLILAYIVL